MGRYFQGGPTDEMDVGVREGLCQFLVSGLGKWVAGGTGLQAKKPWEGVALVGGL